MKSKHLPSAPCTIGTWKGRAYYKRSRWYVLPRDIIGHLGIDVGNQVWMLSEAHPEHLRYLPIATVRGQLRPTPAIPVELALLWLSRIGSRSYAHDVTAAVKLMQKAILEQTAELVPALVVFPALIEDEDIVSPAVPPTKSLPSPTPSAPPRQLGLMARLAAKLGGRNGR